MIFTFKKYNSICVFLKKNYSFEQLFLPDKRATPKDIPFIMLKHDVETNVKKSYKMAMIEKKNGLLSTFYVQAYLIENKKNIKFLKKMQEMGHVISYHHDVMDANNGDIDKAIKDFETKKQQFNNNGFFFTTVCQHGNPMITRNGYHSNRDFFRNENVRKKYPNMIDIMVNFPERISPNYIYISDAGRSWNKINNPTTNDLKEEVDENICNLFDFILNNKETSIILSSHPHRYSSNVFLGTLKDFSFRIIKFAAKILLKIPFIKKIYKKHYWIAKKI